MLHIRPVQESDAEAFLTLAHTLDQETQFMMLEPGERTTSVEEQRQRISAVLQQPNQTILVAEQGGHLVGYLGAYGGAYRRNQHSAYIVIGILQAYAGQGVGTQLFIALEKWARQQHIHRLELTVMTHNERGVNLYRKMGFEIEGTKKDSLYIADHYVDEYYMARLLD